MIAFEPLAEYFELLERNIKGNGLTDVVVPVRKILGRYGDVPDELREVLEGQLDGVRSSRSTSGGDPGRRDHRRSRRSRMDVQGSEHDVLVGGTQIIESFRPVVQFEVDVTCHPEFSALDAFFSSRGSGSSSIFARRDVASDKFRLAELKRLGHVSRAYWYVFDVVAVVVIATNAEPGCECERRRDPPPRALGVRRRMKHVLRSVTSPAATAGRPDTRFRRRRTATRRKRHLPDLSSPACRVSPKVPGRLERLQGPRRVHRGQRVIDAILSVEASSATLISPRHQVPCSVYLGSQVRAPLT